MVVGICTSFVSKPHPNELDTPHDMANRILLVFFVLASTIVTAQLRHPRIQEMERGGPASGNYYCVPTFLFGTQNDDYVDGVSLGSISQLGTEGSGPDHCWIISSQGTIR